MTVFDTMFDTAEWIIKNNTGYDQYERWTVNPSRDGHTLFANRETDCSAFCGIVAKSAFANLDLRDYFYTGTFKDRFVAAGWQAIPFSSLSQCTPGDMVLNSSYHVEFVGRDGRFGSAGIDENGRIAGGQAGNQTGYETRWTAPYIYASGGWNWLLRPPGSAPAVTPTPALGVKQRQVISTAGVNGRLQATTASPIMQYLPASSVGNFDGYVRGENVGGIDIWYRGAYAKRFFWAGAFVGGANTSGLTNLGVVATTGIQQRRVASIAGVNGRASATTNSPVMQTLAYNVVGNFDGWAYGQSVSGNNVWFRGAYNKRWFWSGAFFNGADTTGLARL